MGKCRTKQLTALLLLVLAVINPTSSLADDAGLIVSAEASHKLACGIGLDLEGEFRSRNDFRTADRLSIGAGLNYKVLPWLKASGGYNLLIDNNIEEITYNEDFSYNNWRPGYWGLRHRFNVSLTASRKVQRVEISLRERWQYTYRPSKTIDNFDFDEGVWEDHEVRGKGKNALRSRLQLEWDVPNCKFDPFASVEFFTTSRLDKTRLTIGVDRTVKKKHKFELYYRCQVINGIDKEDNEPNMHMVGLGYTFKF